MEEFLSQAISCQEFDGNVHVVTELRAVGLM
jgi:hypothetical protein